MFLKTLQHILHEFEVDTPYASATEESPLAQLFIEIPIAEQEPSLLELCIIPVPNDEIDLLQCFVQIPMLPPFEPADDVPEFLVAEVQTYLATLNQMLPLVGFSCVSQRIYYRCLIPVQNLEHSRANVLYTIQSIAQLVQICQVSVQNVALGQESAADAIEKIPEIFGLEE